MAPGQRTMFVYNRPFSVLRSDTGIYVVMLTGEIDHHTGVPRFDESLERIRDVPGAKVILSFQDVTYCGSGGIGIVLDLWGTLEPAGGLVAIAGATGPARDPFDLLNIPDMLPFYASVAEALRAIEEGAVRETPKT